MKISDEKKNLVFAARSIRRLFAEPSYLIALFPFALIAPYVPGPPTPSSIGLPYRQELVISLLLVAAFALLLKRAGLQKTFSSFEFAFARGEALTLCAASAFALWTLLSATWAAHKPKAIYEGLTWAIYIAFYALARRAFGQARASRATWRTLGASLFVLSVVCMTVFWSAQVDSPYPVKNSFQYFSGFGEMEATAIPLFAALALSVRRRRIAVLCGLVTICAWLATIQALQRAPLIGAGIGVATVACGALVLRSNRARKMERLGLLVAGLALVTALQIVPSPLTHNRVSNIDRLRQTDVHDENMRVRFFYWGVALEMLRARPLTGVGARNFDSAFPQARAGYASAHPHDAQLNANEDLLISSAHNYYIKILAETGAIGFALFALFGIGALVIFFDAMRRAREKLIPLGAAGAATALALASLTSVNSFMWLGGGLVFFFALALLARTATADDARAQVADSRAVVNRMNFAGLFAARKSAVALACCGCVIALLMTCAAGARALNAMFAGAAQSAKRAGGDDISQAEKFYQRALSFDPFDAATHYDYGMLLYHHGRAAEAAAHLRYAVAHGFNNSESFAYLAAACERAGDARAAEETLAFAVQVYPRSVFLRARHAVALERIGKREEAAREDEVAQRLDARAARGWRELMRAGIDAATEKARADKDIMSPGELLPADAVFAVIAEDDPHMARKVFAHLNN